MLKNIKKSSAKDFVFIRISYSDSQIVQLAAKYNKTPAQIALRYQVDRGHIAIPKSSNKIRLAENIDIFDFKLSDDDLVELNKLDKNKRYFSNDV